MRRAVVLFSSGIDSLAALIWAIERYGKENVTPIYVDMGHRYATKEIYSAGEIGYRLGVRVKIVRAPFVGVKEREDAHIPWRNLFLLTTALYFLPDRGGDIIIQNVQIGETSIKDRTEEFNKKAEELFRWLEDKDVRVISPFKNYTKGQIVRWVLDKGMSEDILKLTVGCYSGDDDIWGSNCGECGACFRRYIALEAAGIKNARAWFRKDPLRWKGVKEYVGKMLKGEYDEKRVTETLHVLVNKKVLKGIIAVDMDNTLCKSRHWWDYANAKPIPLMVDWINKKYDEGFGIIIYTSRFENDRKVTEEWLKKHGVKYHRIVFGKPYATTYVDDKAVKMEEE